MFWTFKLSFAVDNLAGVMATFLKIWLNDLLFSGHPDGTTTIANYNVIKTSSDWH
jgi:hypothetical protein